MPRLEIRVIVLSDSPLDSHSRLVLETIHRYLCDLFMLSCLSLFFLSVMITNLSLQVFLYLFPAGTLIHMEVISCTEAERTYVRVFRPAYVRRHNVSVSVGSGRYTNGPSHLG